MGFVGGDLQQRFTDRIRGVDRERLLAVPIDVGKASAVALVCDFWGEVVTAPFEFPLDERGLRLLLTELARAEAARHALWIRMGLEQAGHYHRTLENRLQSHGFEVVLFNPAQVKENRAQDLLRTLKSDVRDLGAMAELLIRGKGRPAENADQIIAMQCALAAHRRRKVKARTILKIQIHASLDLVFPGLSGCFDNIFKSKFARLILAEGLDPTRVRRLGEDRLRAFCWRRGFKVTRPKAHAVVDVARHALTLPDWLAGTYAKTLTVDVRLLDWLDEEIASAEDELAELLPKTPAGILVTIPQVAVVRASNYGAALGDPARFKNAAQVYRLSGLVPKHYESAGKLRPGMHISREGKVELREAIMELGKGLRMGHSDFARYAGDLVARGKAPGVVLCALAHRANRVAFALMRDQRPFDPSQWTRRTGASWPELGSTNKRRHPSA